jgi:hypothetical protein
MEERKSSDKRVFNYFVSCIMCIVYAVYALLVRGVV